jgi:protein tyrosine phosphatase (PTP) superfamily phosphohydrolase (DUF442 family)
MGSTLEKVMNILNVIRFPGMNYSQITDDLFIGTTPSLHAYDRLRDLGVRLIINMRFSRGPHPDRHHQPIATLWLPSVDSPFFPISIPKLMRGAQYAIETIQRGGRVYTHCAYGRHRGVAMGACILIAQGYEPQAAMELIKQRRTVADPFAYYIRPRILKFANEWNAGRIGREASPWDNPPYDS